MDDLTLRIHTVKKIQPWLASEHARLQTHVLQLVIKQLSESSGPPQTSGTPPSTLQVIKLWYFLPGLLHSFDGLGLLAKDATKRSREGTFLPPSVADGVH